MFFSIFQVAAIPSCVVVLDKQLIEILLVCCDPRNPHSIALLDPGILAITLICIIYFQIRNVISLSNS
jgi:hypothetical protein